MIGNIGIIGLVVILIGLFIAIKKDVGINFIYLMITSILTTTAVITIGDNSITVPHALALIFTLKMLYEVYSGSIKFYLMGKSLLYYLVFCILSIPIGIIISKIMNLDINYRVSSMGIQVVYLVMCLCVFYSVRIAYLNNKINLKIFHFGMIITTLELFFLACFQLMNNHIFNLLFVNRAGHAFIQTLENGQQRLTTAFNEPSMLAIYLSLALIYFTFMFILNRKNIIFVIICLFIGVLSRGSSFILASILWLIISSIIIMRRSTIKNLIIILIAFIIGLSLVNLFTGNLIVNEVINLINKVMGKGVSGSERLLHFKHSIEYFLNSPIVGLGYGTVRSTDWFTTLLANTGITGFILLGNFFLPVVSLSKDNSVQLKGIKIAIITALVVLMVSVPEPYFSFMWIFIAFSLIPNPTYNKDFTWIKENTNLKMEKFLGEK